MKKIIIEQTSNGIVCKVKEGNEVIETMVFTIGNILELIEYIKKNFWEK